MSENQLWIQGRAWDAEIMREKRGERLKMCLDFAGRSGEAILFSPLGACCRCALQAIGRKAGLCSLAGSNPFITGRRQIESACIVFCSDFWAAPRGIYPSTWATPFGITGSQPYLCWLADATGEGLDGAGLFWESSESVWEPAPGSSTCLVIFKGTVVSQAQ